MQCPRCRCENNPEQLFCSQCGKSLVVACSFCQITNKLESKFCGACGMPLLIDSPEKFNSPKAYTPPYWAEKILTSRSTIEGERKQVTVLFCDLVNSTAIANQIGAEAMHGILNRFFELSLSEVHRYEGVINQFLGDGFMALFGAPLSLEDHARRAVMAGLSLQHRLKAAADMLGKPHGVEIAIRAGLNSGLVVVGKIGDNLRMDYTAIGDTTNLAARMQQLAEPGELLLTEQTRRLVMDAFEIESLGEEAVKGKHDPVHVYKVLSLSRQSTPIRPGSLRGLASPLVGRDREFAAFSQKLEELQNGVGGVLFVLGEAGIGKSRLITEVRQHIGSKVLWLDGRAISYSQLLSYWPFLEILKSYLGITEDDDEVASWTKLVKQVVALFPEQVGEILPYLATLLSLQVKGELERRVKYLSGDAMGRQISLASRRFFERVAKDCPLVLAFHDVHWIDQSSVELIEHLLPLINTVPLLICCVSRPVPQSQSARLHKIAKEQYPERFAEIVLSPLSQEDSIDLVQNLLRLETMPTALQHVILAKTEGNPFFIEEVIRSLIDTNVLVQDHATGKLNATSKVVHVRVPDTIEGVIMARIDRLDEDVKEVLRLAAVIGRSFLYRILQTIDDADRNLDSCLLDLQQIELIREKNRAPELEFIFTHALAQEATYESILSGRRKQLHRRVGECIERLFGERLEEFYGLLAYHYARAEDWNKAQEYLFKGADHAGAIAIDSEALEHYQDAMDANAQAFGDRWDPLQRAILERKIGEALFCRGDHPIAIDHLEKALEHLGFPSPASDKALYLAVLSQMLEQVRRRFWSAMISRQTVASRGPKWEEQGRIFRRLFWINYYNNPKRFAFDVLRLLNFAERTGWRSGTAEASAFVGFACQMLSFFKIARYYNRRAIIFAEQSQNPLAVGSACLGKAFYAFHIEGDCEAALDQFQCAAKAYKEVGHIREWAISTFHVTWVLRVKGRFTESLDVSREIMAVGRDSGDHHALSFGYSGLGEALIELGRLDEAIGYLNKAAELTRSIPVYMHLAASYYGLGRCYWMQRRWDLALEFLQKSVTLIDKYSLRSPSFGREAAFLTLTYVNLGEQAQGAKKAEALRKAKGSLHRAMAHAKLSQNVAMIVYRARGTFEWVQGRHGRAQHWWTRSLGLAEKLAFQYEEAMTSLEMGHRMENRSLITRGESLLTQMGSKSCSYPKS